MNILGNGKMLITCPVCLGSELKQKYIVSKKGFMSQPGHTHTLCLGCNSVLLDPQPTEEELIDFYKSQTVEEDIEKEIAHASLNRILDSVKYEYFFQHRIKPLQNYINKDTTIFDVGCGVGAFVKAMKDLGYMISGNDLSNVSLEIGRANYGLTKDELKYGDMKSLDNSDFGCITLWTVIEHLLHPEEYLEYLHGCLKPNGILLIEFPTVDSLMFEKFKEDFFWVMPPYHIYLYSIGGMKKLLDRAGFDVVLEYQMPRNWYFFDVLAKKSNMDSTMINHIKEQAPEFSVAIDTLLDDLAIEQNKSSSVQIIARKRS